MRNRGEMAAFDYFLIAFVLIIILIGGYSLFSSFSSSSKKTQLASFGVSLENSFKEYGTGLTGTPGSVKEMTYSLPEEISKVCFIDNSKASITDQELKQEMDLYPEKNIFFYPSTTFDPLFVDFFNLDENPLCIFPHQGTVSLRLKSTGSGVKLNPQSDTDQEKGCISVRYAKESSSAIDIVFLSSQYNDLALFREDVDRYVQKFLNLEPFTSHKDLLNFFIAEGDAKCTIGEWVTCDAFDVDKIAAQCPHDVSVVLVSRDAINNVLHPVRSSSIHNLISVNTADNPAVVIHEFGHAFGGLADEYVDDEFYGKIRFDSSKYPNCDQTDCLKWKGKKDVGCYEGCSLSSLFRPTEDSIMRSLSSNTYGPLNQEVIASKMGGDQ